MKPMATAAGDSVDVILRDGGTLRLRPPERDDAPALLDFYRALSEPEPAPPLPRAAEPAAAARRVAARAGLGRARRAARRALRRGRRAHRRDRQLRAPARPGAGRVGLRRRRRRSRARGSARGCSSGSRPAPPRVGIERFVAEVLADNRSMLGVFERAGFELKRELAGGVVEVEFPIAPTERFEQSVEERDHTAVVASLRSFFEPTTRRRRRRLAAARHDRRRALPQRARGGLRGRRVPGEPEGRGGRRRARLRVGGGDPGSRRPRRDLGPGRARPRGRRGCAPQRRPRARRHLGRLRRGRQRGRRAAGAAARARALARRAADRAELPRHRRRRPAPERDLRRPLGAERQHRLLLPVRRARPRPARGGRRARARALRLRLDREQGGRLVERPARVVGGRRGDRASCCSTSSRSATRAASAGSPAASLGASRFWR